MQKTLSIPLWEKYCLTVPEAALVFHIGENKLRRIIDEDKDAEFLIWNGTRPLIKRKLFEKYVDKLNVI